MFDKKDLIHSQNLQRLLSKAKIELDAQEILAAADVLRWTAVLHQKIQEDLQCQETQKKLMEGKETIAVPEAAPTTQSLPETPKKTRKSHE